MNPLLVAAKGKGARNVVHRARTISTRYGLSPRRMERRIAAMLEAVRPAGTGPTLPIIASALDRHPVGVRRLAELGIEFAVHGLQHVDHTALSTVAQIEQLGRARRILERHGIAAVGFRAPYLRAGEGTLHALRENGYLYDSSQAMHWPLPPQLETDAYTRLLEFSTSLAATEHPVVPRTEDGLVRIPCCLPDDEGTVERLALRPQAIADLWLDAERRTYDRGELLTLQVHPERVEACRLGVTAVLAAARDRRPGVWVAQLSDIARWWVARSNAMVDVRSSEHDRLHVSVRGPAGTTLLARNLEVSRASDPWAGSWVRVRGADVEIRSGRRPFVGIDPAAPEAVTTFLREQGYIVEPASGAETHTVVVSRRTFTRVDELPLLRELESSGAPLLRLGRWPDGARSAVSVTGDVDALTFWDYALRFVGR